MLKKFGIIAAVAATAVAAVAHAEDGSNEVRLRAVYLDTANGSDAIPALGVPADAIHVNSKWLPDLDLEHFFTPHLSAELVLTYPQSQTVTVGGVPIGSFKHLPPTLTAKYNFLPGSDFQPYVGVGLNATLISKVNLGVPGVGGLDLDRWSFGPAAQVGFDYKLADHWYANVDVKWAMIRSDVKFQGEKISEVRIDPFLFGVGVGYRF